MLQLHGRLKAVRNNPGTDPATGRTFDRETLVVETMGATYYVDKTRDFGTLPDVDTEVVLEVGPRAYVRKDGSAGVGWRAYKNLTPAASGARIAAAS